LGAVIALTLRQSRALSAIFPFTGDGVIGLATGYGRSQALPHRRELMMTTDFSEGTATAAVIGSFRRLSRHSAMVVSGFGGPEVFTEAELPDPIPGPG
jgi:hypothetical protein